MEKAFENENLKVLWIGFQDKESKIKEFIQKHVILESVGYDKGDTISKQYGMRYGAGLVIINGDGIVKKRLAKGFSEKKLMEALKTALIVTDRQLRNK